VVNGLRVAISIPAKNDCEIPINSTGSMKSMVTIIFSKINKTKKKSLTFEILGTKWTLKNEHFAELRIKSDCTGLHRQ